MVIQVIYVAVLKSFEKVLAEFVCWLLVARCLSMLYLSLLDG